MYEKIRKLDKRRIKLYKKFNKINSQLLDIADKTNIKDIKKKIEYSISKEGTYENRVTPISQNNMQYFHILFFPILKYRVYDHNGTSKYVYALVFKKIHTSLTIVRYENRLDSVNIIFDRIYKDI